MSVILAFLGGVAITALFVILFVPGFRDENGWKRK